MLYRGQLEAKRRQEDGDKEGVFGAAGEGEADDDDGDVDDLDESVLFGKQFQLPYTDVHPFVYFYDTFVGAFRRRSCTVRAVCGSCWLMGFALHSCSGLNAAVPALIASVQAALDEQTRADVKEALECGAKQKAEGAQAEL